jgi:hypothetical protein
LSKSLRERNMKGDEFKIILEDINEKFDTLIEGQNLLNEKLDRHIEENREEFKEVRNEILFVRKDISDLTKDLNEHRENTELHAVKKKKKAS